MVKDGLFIRILCGEYLKTALSSVTFVPIVGLWLAGCSVPPPIPGIPKHHPANGFYQHASRSLVSDKSCRDCKGNPDIPMGEIAKGERYLKIETLAPGVFRFQENVTGKTYLGVSYLKRNGFLQIPQACVWEEKRK